MKSKLNSILTFLWLGCFVTTVFADSNGVQSLTLNTGFDHSSNSKYNTPNSFSYLWNGTDIRDDYWILVHDTSTTGNTTPRSSSIMPKHPAWSIPQSNSEWIAFVKNGVPTSNGQNYRQYVFEKCFCLKKGFELKENIENSKLEVNFRADDYAAVYLNESLTNITSQVIPTPFSPVLNSNAPFSILSTRNNLGGYNGGNPASVILKGEELVKRLRVGRNCLQIKLIDLGLIVSGYNLWGNIQLSGIEEVAKFNAKNPRQQFSQCSTCFNRKIMEGGNVFDAANNNTKFEIKAEPSKP